VPELNHNHQGLKIATPSGFDFKVVDRPEAPWEEVQERNLAQPGSTPLLAG
jgi:hypothetical protein